MSTIPHPTVPSRAGSGVWEDVADVVSALGSSLEPRQVLASVGELLTSRIGQPVTVYIVDREKNLLRDPLTGTSARLHPGLAATLQLHSVPVPLDEAWAPSSGDPRGAALGLRDAEVLTGVAFFHDLISVADASLVVVAGMCGAAISRATRFDRMARMTGDSEQTRNLQQQILDHVSHEFNTPLMILRSSADFAREASEEERELFFDMHEQALDRLEQLVHGVIEVAHASAHGESRLFSTEEIVSQLVLPHFVDDEWPDRVPALWHRPGEVQVEGESENLGLAIEHLLRNAQLHAEPAPVAVAIYPARMDCEPRSFELAIEGLRRGEPALPTAEESPDAIFVEVIDTGPGIPAAELGLIFEPFTQASNSPLRGVSGAGMGLATATRLVEAAGGRLEVESMLGTGSIFRMRLPAH